MTGPAHDLRYQLASASARAAYAVLYLRRDELPTALAHHPAEAVAAAVLGVGADEASERIAEMRAAGLVSHDGLVLLVGVAAPRAARATRAVSASPSPTATDVPSDLRERLVAALARGATYRELAESIGTNHTALRRVVNGGRISAPLAALLAAALPVAGTEHGTRSGTARGTVPAAVPAAVPFQPSSSPSDSSPEAQNQKKNPESESGSDAREVGTGTAAGTRNAVPRTTQETPDARERRERWERCEEALMREGGRAVDLRGGAQHKLALRRLCEQAQYTEADCAALGRYLADKPTRYPLPKWVRDRGPVVGLAVLTREFKIEGEVLAELMCSARMWAVDREHAARVSAELDAKSITAVPVPQHIKDKWQAMRDAAAHARREELRARIAREEGAASATG